MKSLLAGEGVTDFDEALYEGAIDFLLVVDGETEGVRACRAGDEVTGRSILLGVRARATRSRQLRFSSRQTVTTHRRNIP